MPDQTTSRKGSDAGLPRLEQIAAPARRCVETSRPGSSLTPKRAHSFSR